MKKKIKDVMGEFNIGIQTIVDFLKSHSIEVKPNPNVRLSVLEYDLIVKKFQREKTIKEVAKLIKSDKSKKESISIKSDLTLLEKQERLEWVKSKINDLKVKKLKKKKKSKEINGLEQTLKEFERNRKYKIEKSGKSILPILTPMKG